jgi:hypothetical protein
MKNKFEYNPSCKCPHNIYIEGPFYDTTQTRFLFGEYVLDESGLGLPIYKM